jgi:hypothetical protein
MSYLNRVQHYVIKFVSDMRQVGGLIHLQFVCQLICQVWDLQGKTVNIKLFLWIIYYKQIHNISYLKNKIFYTVYSVRNIYIGFKYACLFVCFVVLNCDQCLSLLKLWVRIPLMARCTEYNIMWYSLLVTCDMLVVFSWYSRRPVQKSENQPMYK